MQQEREYVKLLAVFHWVVAGFAFLFSLLPLIHFAVGIAMVSGAFRDARGEAPVALIGWFLVIFATVFIVTGLTFAVCLAIAARRLARFRHYTYCLVMAGVACMFVPFGTVLGVFTIIVLMKPAVRAMFDVAAPRSELP